MILYDIMISFKIYLNNIVFSFFFFFFCSIYFNNGVFYFWKSIKIFIIYSETRNYNIKFLTMVYFLFLEINQLKDYYIYFILRREIILCNLTFNHYNKIIQNNRSLKKNVYI
jgi:hypothetical protein